MHCARVWSSLHPSPNKSASHHRAPLSLSARICVDPWISSTRKKGRRRRRETQHWVRTSGTWGPVVSTTPTLCTSRFRLRCINKASACETGGRWSFAHSVPHAFMHVEAWPEPSPG